MNTHIQQNPAYTIREAAKLSGLRESTLRYYETIGIIHPIKRDPSSKQRVYTENDVNLIVGISCLSALGMSIEDMRIYLQNAAFGEKSADEQITLLETQTQRLEDEEQNIKLRQKYLQTKIHYWKATKSGNKSLAEEIAKQAIGIAKEIKQLDNKDLTKTYIKENL
jgi:DNA-binding transcriptional MerR regulator